MSKNVNATVTLYDSPDFEVVLKRVWARSARWDVRTQSIIGPKRWDVYYQDKLILSGDGLNTKARAIDHARSYFGDLKRHAEYLAEKAQKEEERRLEKASEYAFCGFDANGEAI